SSELNASRFAASMHITLTRSAGHGPRVARVNGEPPQGGKVRARRFDFSGSVVGEFPNAGRDVANLVLRELRVDRECECFLRGRLGLRHVALAVTERGEALLQVKRNRVVNLRADAPLVEELLELVAAVATDHVLVVDVAGARIVVRAADA